MWTIKQFKTSRAMQEWINANSGRVCWNEVFVNNGYAIEYRPLRQIELAEATEDEDE
jgi:hypothetical protein